MSKRINISALVMIAALLLCQLNLTVIGDSYSFASDSLSDGCAVREQYISPIADIPVDDFCSLETINGPASAPLLSVRSQTKGPSLQRTLVRILLLFTSILCLLKIAGRYCKGWLYLPNNAIPSFFILSFIHNKDGKK